jgi:hypothetical protein
MKDPENPTKESMAEMEIKVVKSFYIWSSSEMKINQLFN